MHLSVKRFIQSLHLESMACRLTLLPISAEARCARVMRAWRTACVDVVALQMQAVRFEQTRRAVACARTWSDVASHAAWYHPHALDIQLDNPELSFAHAAAGLM